MLLAQEQVLRQAWQQARLVLEELDRWEELVLQQAGLVLEKLDR